MTSREQFEEFITAPPFERDVDRWPDDETAHAWPGDYKDYEVQLAWVAWEAGREVGPRAHEGSGVR